MLPILEATVYAVGGEFGWNVPPDTFFYDDCFLCRFSQ